MTWASWAWVVLLLAVAMIVFLSVRTMEMGDVRSTMRRAFAPHPLMTLEETSFGKNNSIVVSICREVRAIAVEWHALVDELAAWHGHPGAREGELRAYPARVRTPSTERAGHPGRPCAWVDERDAYPGRVPTWLREVRGDPDRMRVWLDEMRAW